MMKYKGYIGQFELDEDAGIFHGEVMNTRDVITFQGKTAKELLKAFKDSIDDYLDYCEQRGEEPEKPFSGQFVVRVTPDLHKAAAASARMAGKSLNAWVSSIIERSSSL
ncbi:MAG: type II toxin-antitoxin system HicB family antitoxin [Proteobacteria bacterium]|nr:type II toxin-antitoxin system HicB family antitoxin [Pseudomonadota bacterium]